MYTIFLENYKNLIVKSLFSYISTNFINIFFNFNFFVIMQLLQIYLIYLIKINR